MDGKNLKNLSNEELIQKEIDFKKELFEMRAQQTMENVDKPHMFKILKKNIARIKTFLKERESDAGKNK